MSDPGDLPVRADFPVLSRLVDGQPISYLDSAATSLKPATVIDAVTRYYAEVGASIHRGKHILSEEASETYELARVAAGRFTGVPANALVFTQNTTAGMNLLADGILLRPGDLVMTTADAHHSASLPWRTRGAQVLAAPVDEDGRVDLDAFAELADRHRPRVAVLSACSNVTGRYAPLAELTRLSREVGAIVVVDAAQYAPHRRFGPDLAAADAFVFSAHKMLGPTGIGVLGGREELLDSLITRNLGGGTVDWVDADSHRPRKLPHRLEAGTPDIAAAYGLLAAFDYLDRLGMDRVAEHDAAMAAELCGQAGKRDHLVTLGGLDAGDRAGILSVEVRGCTHLSEIARILSDAYGIMARTGHLCAQPLVDSRTNGEVLRFSAYVYTTAAEIDAAFTALDEVYDRVVAR